MLMMSLLQETFFMIQPNVIRAVLPKRLFYYFHAFFPSRGFSKMHLKSVIVPDLLLFRGLRSHFEKHCIRVYLYVPGLNYYHNIAYVVFAHTRVNSA